MRVVVTGQVGLDKVEFLAHTVAAAERMGRRPVVYNIGERMYAEAPDVPPGRILNLPLSRLTELRRSVFKDVLAQAAGETDVIVNTHATFRWRHGLFYGFDHDIMKDLNADLYVVLVDNIDRVHARLRRDGHSDHSLKDLMVWREEESLATELLAEIVRGHGAFYIFARGIDGPNAAELAKLIFAPQFRKAYLSFPMSHVAGNTVVAAEVHRLRTQMRKYFTCFDPADIEEKPLAAKALAAAQQGRRVVRVRVDGNRMEFDTAELVGIISDIDGQIYARDFKLIDQSDMIISLIPELPAGAGGAARAAISSGVERELQHAHETGKDVFVIWPSAAPQSPFVTETATAVFASIDEAVRHFVDNGYVPEPSPGGLFA